MSRFLQWPLFRQLRELLEETAPSSAEMALRLRSVERDIILPVKAVVIAILFYNLFFSSWFDEFSVPEYVAQAFVERFFLIYLVLNVAVAFLLIISPRLPLLLMQRMIFTSNFVDGLFLAAITFVTGGFDSVLYWLFLGLIIRNAISCPLAVPQLLLNFSASLCYLVAGIFNEILEAEGYPRPEYANPAEPFLLRLFVLWLLILCCYGVQVLLERHRQAVEEAREFIVRQHQLRSAGRLAAQIAHQIKNPLGIINNAAFSIQRAIQEGRNSSAQQLQIIREEVERADRIITKLMGYAQLAEGKVEKLDVAQEVDRAIAEVFPPGVYETTVERRVDVDLPPIFMQRNQLSEILKNLLTNAREALGGKGEVAVTAKADSEGTVFISVRDNGPGIAKDRIEKIFQPYFSTKERGTGLGLAIVRQNAEIYGGTISVESELGKGACFIVKLPTRTFMKIQA